MEKLIGSYFLILLLGVIGWIINLIQIVVSLAHHAEFSVLIIARMVGVIAAPLGSVLGLFVW